MHTPNELDRKSLCLHQLVAQKIRSNPALFHKAREALQRRVTNAAPSSLSYMIQWVKIFDRGMEEARAIAIEETERGQVLRSASPFAGILDEDERQEFLRKWSKACFCIRQMPSAKAAHSTYAR